MAKVPEGTRFCLVRGDAAIGLDGRTLADLAGDVQTNGEEWYVGSYEEFTAELPELLSIPLIRFLDAREESGRVVGSLSAEMFVPARIPADQGLGLLRGDLGSFRDAWSAEPLSPAESLVLEAGEELPARFFEGYSQGYVDAFRAEFEE